MARTIIVSDLHLGACNSETTAILGLLRQDFDRLVLNGDTLDHLNFRRFRDDHWSVLEQLKMLARDRELVLLRGNHEGLQQVRTMSYGPLDVLSSMLETPVREDYELWVGRRHYLVLHGDVYDRTINLTRVAGLADDFYRTVQRCNRSAARWLKMRVKHWGGVVQAVRSAAVCHAKERRCQGIIVGHTHFCEDAYVDGIHYLNSGCWVETPCTYVEADDHGIRLRSWTGELSVPVAEPEPMLCVA